MLGVRARRRRRRRRAACPPRSRARWGGRPPARAPRRPGPAAADAPAPRKPRRVAGSGTAVTAGLTLAEPSAVLERPAVGGAQVVEQLLERLLRSSLRRCPPAARRRPAGARSRRRQRAQRPTRATSGSSRATSCCTVAVSVSFVPQPAARARPRPGAVGLPLDPPLLLGHLEGIRRPTASAGALRRAPPRARAGTSRACVTPRQSAFVGFRAPAPDSSPNGQGLPLEKALARAAQREAVAARPAAAGEPGGAGAAAEGPKVRSGCRTRSTRPAGTASVTCTRLPRWRRSSVNAVSLRLCTSQRRSGPDRPSGRGRRCSRTACGRTRAGLGRARGAPQEERTGEEEPRRTGSGLRVLAELLAHARRTPRRACSGPSARRASGGAGCPLAARGRRAAPRGGVRTSSWSRSSLNAARRSTCWRSDSGSTRRISTSSIVVGHVLVHADDDVLLLLVALLVAPGRLLHLGADERDALHRAAELVHLVDQRLGARPRSRR